MSNEEGTSSRNAQTPGCNFKQRFPFAQSGLRNQQKDERPSTVTIDISFFLL